MFYKTKLLIIGPANKGKLWYISVHILPVFSGVVGGQIGAINQLRQNGTRTACASVEVCVFVQMFTGRKLTEDLRIKLLTEKPQAVQLITQFDSFYLKYKSH